MKNKTTAARISVITAIIAVVFCIFSAASPVYATKILLNTPLYQEASFDSETVLKEIRTNETVEKIGDVVRDETGKEWIKVRYNERYEGYVPYGYLYQSAGTEDYDMQVVKVTGSSTSEKIPLYSYYDTNSEIVGELVDGEKLNLVLDDNSYGEFSRVIFDGKYCFVKTSNITTGLTYNQKLALIISVALFVLLLAAGVVAVVIIQKKKKSGKSA